MSKNAKLDFYNFFLKNNLSEQKNQLNLLIYFTIVFCIKVSAETLEKNVLKCVFNCFSISAQRRHL